MERVSINKDNYGTQRDKIPVSGIYTDNVYLYIFVDGFYKIKPSDFIELNRYVFSENSKENVPVATVRKTVEQVYYDGQKTMIVVKAEAKNLLKIKEIQSEDGYNIITFEQNTNVFAQDVVFAQNKGLTPTIQVYNPQDSTYIDIVSEIFFNEVDRIDGKKNYEFIVNPCCPASDFIYNTYNQTDYNDCDKDTSNPTKSPMYYYLPNKTDSNVLVVKEDISSYQPLNLYYKFNSFYCQSETPTEISGITMYECYFWQDIIRGEITQDNIDKYNVITIDKIMDFWGVSVGLTSNIDYSHLYQEFNITELYTSTIKNKVINDNAVIDMEKMKFSPYYEDSGTYYPITSITYNLHFRQRELEDGEWSYLDDEDSFWNPKVLESGETESGSTLMPDDLPSAMFSDMLYYLGFTDNDVQNQKQKIRKSFLRLSFYTSPDPLTQKLIYYSSIFMDSGELFGRYIKGKNELIRNGKSGDNVVLESQESEKYRLDCRFVVKNEYCTTKSSDGFNIYYFPDDIASEIEGKTIYMKVEFNHAGYGRTIPMIVWPEDGLTMDEIKEGALYIPITMKCLDETENVNETKGFAYIFEENTYIKRENNTIMLNLVEPKILD